MLGIVPATEVQPAVVVLIHVVKDDEETFVSGILFRAYLIYIAVAGNLTWVQTDAALFVAGLLDEAALSLPLSRISVGNSCKVIGSAFPFSSL